MLYVPWTQQGLTCSTASVMMLAEVHRFLPVTSLRVTRDIEQVVDQARHVPAWREITSLNCSTLKASSKRWKAGGRRTQ
jgi:hypothetical protein